MTQLEAFIARCDRVAKSLGISRSALSNRIMFDSRRLDQIADGKDIGVRRMLRAEAALDAIEASRSEEQVGVQAAAG